MSQKGALGGWRKIESKPINKITDTEKKILKKRKKGGKKKIKKN
ncbi:hypothetical protein PP707_07745 [Acetobacter pasteurianus]|nr:hypothetical protein [Acetobacter pasteurianus]